MWIVNSKMPSGQWAGSTGFVNLEHVCSYMGAMQKNGCESFTVKWQPDNVGMPVRNNLHQPATKSS